MNNNNTNDPPTISVLSPGASDAVVYGTSYTIRWSDSDPDSDATITLGYDTVASGCTGTVIAGGISENDPANSYAWNIAALAYNTSYWVYAKITDGTTTVLLLCSERAGAGQCRDAASDREQVGDRDRDRDRRRSGRRSAAVPIAARYIARTPWLP